MGVLDFIKTALSALRRGGSPGLAPNLYVENAVLPWESAFKALWPENFRKNASAYKEWAYVCTRVIADGVSSVPLRLYVAKNSSKKSALSGRAITKSVATHLIKKSGLSSRVAKAVVVEEVLEHPFLDMLKNVNPFFNRFDLIDHTVINLELMGNAYWYKRRDALGVTRELWNIPAQHVWVVPDKKLFIKGYLFQAPGAAGPSAFEERDVIHFKYVDPNNLYYGVAPLSAMAQAYNTQEALNTYTNAAFANMGRPEGLLTTDGTISDENFERLKKRFRQQYTGGQNAMKTLVVDQGVKYVQMALKPVDMGTKETRRDVLERVAAAFRVPLAKLITENVNKSNAEAAQVDFLRDTVIPRLVRLEEKINEKLMPEYGPEYFVAFDNPLPDDREFRLAERESNIRSGYTTRNEERANDGLPPLPEGGDDLPALDTAGTGAVSDDAEPEPTPVPPIFPVDDPNDADEKNRKNEAAIYKKWRRKISDRQRAINQFMADSREMWIEKNKEKMRAAYEPALSIAGAGTVEDYGLKIDWSVNNPEMTKHMGTRLEETSLLETDAEIQAIKAALQEGTALGESIKDLAARVEDKFGDDYAGGRARLIAMTETTNSYTNAQLDIAKKAGMEGKTWMSGGNPRPTHEALDNKTIPLDDDFDVGGFPAEGPGMTGEAKEDCNCDCTLALSESADGKSAKTKALLRAMVKRRKDRGKKCEAVFATAYKSVLSAQIKDILKFIRTLED